MFTINKRFLNLKSQRDSTDDIDKAYNLFIDPEKKNITFQSLKKVVEELSKLMKYSNKV